MQGASKMQGNFLIRVLLTWSVQFVKVHHAIYYSIYIYIKNTSKFSKIESKRKKEPKMKEKRLKKRMNYKFSCR